MYEHCRKLYKIKDGEIFIVYNLNGTFISIIIEKETVGLFIVLNET